MSNFERQFEPGSQFPEKKEFKSDITAQIQDGEERFSNKFSNAPRIIGKFIYGLAILTTFAAGEPAFAAQKEQVQQTQQEQVAPVSGEQMTEQEKETQKHLEYYQEIQKDFNTAMDSADAGNKKLMEEYFFDISKKEPKEGIGKFLKDEQIKLTYQNIYPAKVKYLSNGDEIQFWVDQEGFIKDNIRYTSFPPMIGSGIINSYKFVEFMNERHPDNAPPSDMTPSQRIEQDRKNLENAIDEIKFYLLVYKEIDNNIEEEYARQRLIEKVEKITADYGQEVFQDGFWQEYQKIVGK
ncbi:MAG: hypothetical protein PHF10_00995 [Patescibacteria group bacterium]|nr:hypothetical protein [Patescibacteria group bacterium]MDD5534314.1 hypothetical protein [Patescibacteria group bacterium]